MHFHGKGYRKHETHSYENKRMKFNLKKRYKK